MAYSKSIPVKVLSYDHTGKDMQVSLLLLLLCCIVFPIIVLFFFVMTTAIQVLLPKWHLLFLLFVFILLFWYFWFSLNM